MITHHTINKDDVKGFLGAADLDKAAHGTAIRHRPVGPC